MRDAFGVQQMPGFGRRGTVDRQKGAYPQQALESLVVACAGILVVGRAHHVLIMDLHIEAASALGHGAADAAHTQYAEPLAADLGAQQPGRRPGRPRRLAHHRLARAGLSRRPQQEEHRHIRGGVGQHVGGVGDGDAALGGRGDVDVIVADREGGDGGDGFRKPCDHLGRDAVRRAYQQCLGALGAGDHRLGVIERVLGVQPRLVIARQAGLDAGWQAPCDEHGRLRCLTHRIAP